MCHVLHHSMMYIVMPCVMCHVCCTMPWCTLLCLVLSVCHVCYTIPCCTLLCLVWCIMCVSPYHVVHCYALCHVSCVAPYHVVHCYALCDMCVMCVAPLYISGNANRGYPSVLTHIMAYMDGKVFPTLPFLHVKHDITFITNPQPTNLKI